jgi:photosystem II stability/assembly factor-like uncharacterized protein
VYDEFESVEMSEPEDFVYGLVVSPAFARDGVCFAARRSGLYRSDDGGVTWRSTYDSLDLQAPLATTAVAVSPDFESSPYVLAGTQGGFLRSTDGGENWQVVMLPPPPPLISTLAISPDFAQDGTVLAGTMEDGVFRSANRGSDWSRWNFGLLDLNVLCMVISPNFAQDEMLLVGTESGIFRSANGGRAWREVDFPIDYAPVLSLALSPANGGGDALIVGTEAHGVFYSSASKEEAVNGIVLSPEFPTKPQILAALSERLLVSRDGGQSWADWKAGLIVEQGISVVVAPYGLDQGVELLVGTMEGQVLKI